MKCIIVLLLKTYFSSNFHAIYTSNQYQPKVMLFEKKSNDRSCKLCPKILFFLFTIPHRKFTFYSHNVFRDQILPLVSFYDIISHQNVETNSQRWQIFCSFHGAHTSVNVLNYKNSCVFICFIFYFFTFFLVFELIEKNSVKHAFFCMKN